MCGVGGSHPEVPVKNFITGRAMTSRGRLFGLWSASRLHVDRFVDTLGSIPADMVKGGFKLIKRPWICRPI